MFFEIVSAAFDPTTDSYEIVDIIRVAVALAVLVSGFLAVVFILW
jgi:hypothetical protein